MNHFEYIRKKMCKITIICCILLETHKVWLSSVCNILLILFVLSFFSIWKELQTHNAKYWTKTNRNFLLWYFHIRTKIWRSVPHTLLKHQNMQRIYAMTINLHHQKRSQPHQSLDWYKIPYIFYLFILLCNGLTSMFVRL